MVKALQKQGNVRTLIHSPADLATEYVQWAEYTRKYPGITWGVKSIDQVVIPMRPGELISILSRPGHGKTTTLARFAKIESQRLMKQTTNNVVVYVTYESPAEVLEAMFQADQSVTATDIAWGRADMSIIKSQAVKRARIPLWIIGHGIGRAGQRMPRMYPETILDAIEAMESTYNVKPSLILFDYIQIIPIEDATDRVTQVTNAPFLIKELALRVGAPAVCAVQAARRVDDYKEKIPNESDSQWSSALEQCSDKMFGIWRPSKTEGPDSIIELEDGRQFPVTENLFLLRMLKQRGDRARFTWALHFDMATLKLAELELQRCKVDDWQTA